MALEESSGLFAATSIHTKYAIKWTEADKTGSQRNDADPPPWCLWPDEDQGDQHQAKNYANDLINGTYIFHRDFLLWMNCCEEVWQGKVSLSVTLSHWVLHDCLQPFGIAQSDLASLLLNPTALLKVLQLPADYLTGAAQLGCQTLMGNNEIVPGRVLQ